MDNNNQNGLRQGNNFLSVFLLGFLIGAVVVFLFGTEKGKKLLKVISEKGEKGISNLLEDMDSSLDLDGIESQEEEVRPDEMPERKEDDIAKTVIQKPLVRRFFRGVPRRVN